MQLQNNYYQIEKEYLPTGGIFYPSNITILFKSASLNIIRYISSFDESDFDDNNIIMNYILENVCKVFIDEKEIEKPQYILNKLDRMYILLASKELTFPDVFSDIHFEYECKFCNNVERIELIKNFLSQIELGKFERFYNPNRKSFVLDEGEKDELELFIPNLNSDNIINKFKIENPEILEHSFFRYVKYLIPYNIDEHFNLNDIFKKVRKLELNKLLFLIIFADYFDKQLSGGVYFICSNCQTKSNRLFSESVNISNVDLNTLSNSFFSNTNGIYKNIIQTGIDEFLDLIENLKKTDIDETMNWNILKSFQMDLNEISNFEYTLVRHLRFDHSLFFDDNVPFYWLWDIYLRLKDEKEEEEKQHKAQQNESQLNSNPDRMFNKAGSMMKGLTGGLKMPNINMPKF